MAERDPPVGGPLSGGYLNAVFRHVGTVRKTYLGAQAATRRHREHRALVHLGRYLEVPRIIPGGDDHTLILEFIDGETGQHLMRDGQPGLVLHLCGAVLRRLQAVDTRVVNGALPGSGTVIVHGDFGPQNVLIRPEAQKISAVIDWEFCHIGTPTEDVAWAEWIVRRHNGDAVDSLPELFAGYGSTPGWEVRKQSMTGSLRRMRSFSVENGDTQAVALWDERIDEAAAWGRKEFTLKRPV